MITVQELYAYWPEENIEFVKRISEILIRILQARQNKESSVQISYSHDDLERVDDYLNSQGFNVTTLESMPPKLLISW